VKKNVRTIIRSSNKGIVEKPKRKKTGRWYHLYCPLYFTDIVMYNGDQNTSFDIYDGFAKKFNIKNKELILKKLHNYIGSPDNTSDWYCMNVADGDDGQSVIIYSYMRDPNDTDQISSLSHECLHAAIFILNQKGVMDDDCGFEALTYLHDWIFHTMLDAIKRDEFPKRKKKTETEKTEEVKNDNNC